MHISTKNKIKYFGISRYCPICKSFVKYFKPFGADNRPNALCPVCNSLERHRLLWLYFKNELNLFNLKHTFLHVAPENCFIRRFKKLKNLNYYNIDMYSDLADTIMDLTNLKYGNKTFNLFYCGHVLEHIPDDKKAMSEIFRILEANGQAIITVPIIGKETKEDLSITDPIKRTELYGQKDHVRYYGLDIKNKLISQGFKVDIIDYFSHYSNFKQKYFGLIKEYIFHCKK